MQKDTTISTSDALYSAVSNGDIDQAISLLAEGADFDAYQDGSKQTPLMVAAEVGNEEAVRRLLEYGANVNAKNIHQETALALAAAKGYTEVASILLDWGAEVNVVDEFEDTPLLNAAWGEHENTLRLLLSRGADPDVLSQANQTAMTTALAFDRKNILAILLEGGANPDLRHGDQTPLMMALHDQEAVRLLLAHGADITLKDNHGKTALKWALEDCAHDAIPLLKAAGAKV